MFKVVKVMIDYNNQSTAWWENGGSDLYNDYLHTKDKYGYLTLDPKTAKAFVTRAKDIKGWYSPDTPYAPNPLQFQNENGEELDYTDILEDNNETTMA